MKKNTGRMLLGLVWICFPFLLLMVVIGTYAINGYSSMSAWTGFGSKVQTQDRSSQSLTAEGSLSSDDPAVQFSKTQVGHVLFTEPGSSTCKRQLFDNRTGEMVSSIEVACGR